MPILFENNFLIQSHHRKGVKGGSRKAKKILWAMMAIFYKLLKNPIHIAKSSGDGLRSK